MKNWLHLTSIKKDLNQLSKVEEKLKPQQIRNVTNLKTYLFNQELMKCQSHYTKRQWKLSALVKTLYSDCIQTEEHYKVRGQLRSWVNNKCSLKKTVLFIHKQIQIQRKYLKQKVKKLTHSNVYILKELIKRCFLKV